MRLRLQPRPWRGGDPRPHRAEWPDRDPAPGRRPAGLADPAHHRPAPAQVTPDPEALRRITAERARLAAARATDSPRTDFAAGFLLPAHGRISGVFGSQRILNGEPRQPHFGFDIAAPTGTPLLAAAGGVVTLAGDFFFFGRIVVIDHGHGVNTLYAHMSAQGVTEGQQVAAGQRIGAIGATGRVTGPHLHFGFSWYTTWLDAQPVLPPVTG
ncbi:M23 family metallopeptidase [Paeniroseomonas aquatica]|uniref:M23 family metallopeptidase n=1 Tax=Paeniroseomonas aquatica TaxID=373043 RepID=UPI003621259F